jgi:outer membrane protein TolC
VERLKSRRTLTEGKLQVALLRLKSIAGIPPNEAISLRNDLAKVVLRAPPASVEIATNIAFHSRPDLRLARLNEEVAQAGLRLPPHKRLPAQPSQPDIPLIGTLANYQHS